MNIIAASAMGLGETFLHAGYVSAQPAGGTDVLSCLAPVNDAVKALDLGPLAEAGAVAMQPMWSPGTLTTLVVGVLGFFGVAAALYCREHWRSSRAAPGESP